MDVNMKLVLYTDGSQEAAAARLFLESHALEFEEVDVRTQECFDRLVKRTQQKRAPALEIKRSHSVGVIVGFDEKRFSTELRL